MLGQLQFHRKASQAFLRNLLVLLSLWLVEIAYKSKRTICGISIIYMLYGFLRLPWVISFLDKRLCRASLAAFFAAQRKTSQDPAGRSGRSGNQAGPPAAQTGLHPVPDCLLEYFFNVFHFIPPALPSVQFNLAFYVVGLFPTTQSLLTPPCPGEKELMFVGVSSCTSLSLLCRTSLGQEYFVTLCA